jgi:hypothetical protein
MRFEVALDCGTIACTLQLLHVLADHIVRLCFAQESAVYKGTNTCGLSLLKFYECQVLFDVVQSVSFPALTGL